MGVRCVPCYNQNMCYKRPCYNEVAVYIRLWCMVRTWDLHKKMLLKCFLHWERRPFRMLMKLMRRTHWSSHSSIDRCQRAPQSNLFSSPIEINAWLLFPTHVNLRGCTTESGRYNQQSQTWRPDIVSKLSETRVGVSCREGTTEFKWSKFC